MRAIGVIALACLVVACGSDPTASSEYAALQDERDALETDAEKASDASEKLESQLADLEAQVAQAKQEAEHAAADLADRDIELTAANDRATELESMQTAYEDLAIGLLEAYGLSPVERRCIVAGLAADADARDEFVKTMYAYEDISDEIPAFTALGTECGVDVQELFVMPGVLEGEAYGDNPELDALHDRCAMGDGEACDELYFASAIGSEYERFGATCGDRFEDEMEHSGFCEDAI